MAVQYLLSMGHKKIANFPDRATRYLFPDVDWASKKRLGEDWLCCHVFTNSSFGNNRQFAKDFIQSKFDITAVFCDNDIQAENFYRIAINASIKIPDELSVIGFADLPLAEKTVPRTYNYPSRRLSTRNNRLPTTIIKNK